MSSPSAAGHDARARFAVIVSTIGRVEPLEQLFDSLLRQSVRDFVVALCVQGDEPAVRRMLERRPDFQAFRLSVTTSERGLSRGRNTAAALVGESAEYLLFPNDTSVLPPTFLERLGAELHGQSAACVTVVDAFGAKFELPPRDEPLNPRNVWNVIAPGLVMRQDVFGALGGFDEELGSGTRTPWQSGEETDLLLRYLKRYGSSGFAWLGGLELLGVADTSGLSRAERRVKLRGYGRGCGRVLALHGYRPTQRVRTLVGGLAFGLRHGSQYDPLDGLWVAAGRLEGLTGRLLPGSSATQAVKK